MENLVIIVIVIANKMDNFEEVYAENIEKEGEIFLEGIQNKKSLGELEKEYSKKVKEIRRIYERSLRKDLNEEKEKEIQKAKNKTRTKEKEEREFHVKNLNLDKSWGERKQIEITSLGYKTKIKIKNFFRIVIPNYLVYTYYKIKRSINYFFKDIMEIFIHIFEKISDKISNSLSFVKEGFIKVLSILKRIINIFKIKKSKKEEDGKKISKKQE
jgi:hypothetical protein